jgi:hypothetical protein
MEERLVREAEEEEKKQRGKEIEKRNRDIVVLTGPKKGVELDTSRSAPSQPSDPALFIVREG